MGTSMTVTWTLARRELSTKRMRDGFLGATKSAVVKPARGNEQTPSLVTFFCADIASELRGIKLAWARAPQTVRSWTLGTSVVPPMRFAVDPECRRLGGWIDPGAR